MGEWVMQREIEPLNNCTALRTACSPSPCTSWTWIERLRVVPPEHPPAIRLAVNYLSLPIVSLSITANRLPLYAALNPLALYHCQTSPSRCCSQSPEPSCCCQLSLLLNMACSSSLALPDHLMTATLRHISCPSLTRKG